MGTIVAEAFEEGKEPCCLSWNRNATGVASQAIWIGRQRVDGRGESHAIVRTFRTCARHGRLPIVDTVPAISEDDPALCRRLGRVTAHGSSETDQTRRPTMVGAVRAALLEFHRQGRGHDAAALTYYAVLAVVPAVVALVAVVGLFGQDPETTDAILEIIGRAGPAAATETFRGTVEGIIRNKSGAGALLGAGVVGAVWSATGWLDAFFRVANATHHAVERRPFIRRKALQVGVTLAVGFAMVILTTLVVVTGPIAREAADALGAGDSALNAWSIGKWPCAAVLAITLVGVLFRIAPDVAERELRSSIVAAALAVVAWSTTSAGFGLYVASFGSYNATYGALGAVVVFLVWLWITNAVLIVGASVDARLTKDRTSLDDRGSSGGTPQLTGGQDGTE